MATTRTPSFFDAISSAIIIDATVRRPGPSEQVAIDRQRREIARLTRINADYLSLSATAPPDPDEPTELECVLAIRIDEDAAGRCDYDDD